jgi:hypothetical protein
MDISHARSAAEGATPRETRRRSLPVYQAGGSREPIFVALKRKEEGIAAEVSRLSLDELRRHPLLSANAKTSVSLDFPIGHTCDPTPICASVCYGASPRAAATWRKSLRKRLRNLRYIRLVSPEEAADRLAREMVAVRRRWAPRARVDYLRINGTGDLFPEIVPVINLLAASNPELRIWIVTRRFELAAQITALPNIFLQLSLDRSTPPALERAARDLVAQHPRAYLSFLRSRPEDDTRAAAIVFNEKRTKALPYESKTDCPADAGRLPLDNVRGVGGTACARCRKCFSEATVVRQRRLLEVSP